MNLSDKGQRNAIPLLAVGSLAVGEGHAAVAIASLADPARLATLGGDRAANPRLKKYVYWLAEARGRGRTAEQVIDEAQRLNGNADPHGALVRESLLRNLDIADNLGCTSARES